MTSPAAMPRLTAGRMIAAVVAVLIVLLLVFYGKDLKPCVWEMNEMLASDPVLSAYPYNFRIVNFINGVVTVTRPYTDASGPGPFLVHTHPSLAGLGPNDPAMQGAVETLRLQEMRVRELLTAQPGVEAVDWWLDQAWFDRNRVPLPADAADAQKGG